MFPTTAHVLLDALEADVAYREERARASFTGGEAPRGFARVRRLLGLPDARAERTGPAASEAWSPRPCTACAR